MQSITKRFSFGAAVALVAVLVVTSHPSRAESGPKCKAVSGKISLQPVSGAACLSPVGLCATGTISGGLKGTFDIVASGIIPTVDTPTTGVVVLTADRTIATPYGEISTKDAITLQNGTGRFSEIDVVIGGTQGYQGVTGYLTSAGTYDLAAGGSGDYVGELCFP